MQNLIVNYVSRVLNRLNKLYKFNRKYELSIDFTADLNDPFAVHGNGVSFSFGHGPSNVCDTII